MVRGKFKLSEISRQAGVESQHLKFVAVCNDGTPENERFHRYTPSGSLEMRVDNPSALACFELGECYYLDFTPCESSK